MNLLHRWQALGELSRRYRIVFAHFWSNRHAMNLPDLLPHESEFLPAALSIQSAPVSPTGRLVARILMLMLGTLLLWSIFGQVDIIVNGEGKIIASGYTKTITSAEVTSVSGIYVNEGQSVNAGDLLLELDARMANSERDKADGDQQIALLQAARAKALLIAIEGEISPMMYSLEGVELQRWPAAKLHLLDQWQDYLAKKSRLEDEINNFKDELSLALQREADYEQLAKTRDVSQHAWMEKKQSRIDLQRQLEDTRNQVKVLKAETRRNVQDALNEAQRIAASSGLDAHRAKVHGELLKLYAPVGGTVQQLSVHTLGAAVPAAHPLMQIVPRQAKLELEAFIENKDVGFVQEGQTVQVKIDAFEYTKYGTIEGIVSHVSRDAIQDEKRGLVYSVKVLLSKQNININGKDANLSAGMTGSVEIKTGERRVIEYVLSPLIKHAQESVRER